MLDPDHVNVSAAALRLRDRRSGWCSYVFLGMLLYPMSQQYPTLTIMCILWAVACIFDSDQNPTLVVAKDRLLLILTPLGWCGWHFILVILCGLAHCTWHATKWCGQVLLQSCSHRCWHKIEFVWDLTSPYATHLNTLAHWTRLQERCRQILQITLGVTTPVNGELVARTTSTGSAPQFELPAALPVPTLPILTALPTTVPQSSLRIRTNARTST